MPGWPTGHREPPPAITAPAARFPNDLQRAASRHLLAGHRRWPVSAVAGGGLGAMGGRIAARLLGPGHGVPVWNRTPGKARPPARPRAAPAARPRRARDPAA